MTKRKKTGKRGRGEGSVTQRKDKRWQTSMMLENGKRKYFYGKTQAEALDKLHVAQEQQRQGKLATGPQQTVKQFLEDWLEKVHRFKIRYNSLTTYRHLLKNHVLPALGHLKLRNLTAYDIETLYSKMQQKKLKAETIRGVHRVLHKAFGDAVRWKRLPHNICDDVQQPSEEEFEMQLLTEEQAKVLIETVKGTPLEAIIPLALGTALRGGEILGLLWSHIDFEEKSLTVKQTAYRVEGEGIVTSEPKTTESKSKILLPQFVVDVLLLHRERQTHMRLKAGDKWEEHDLVFPNSKGKFMTYQYYFGDKFKKMLKKANLPEMRFHDLRHSCATILLEMGVHPKLVQNLLRHAKLATTMDRYSHVRPKMQRKVMDDLDIVFLDKKSHVDIQKEGE
jgi:integrase